MFLDKNETGIGFMLCVAQNLFFFIGVPRFAEYYWPYFLSLRDELGVDIYPYMVAYVTIL